jgi:hypothetical protein
MGNTLSCAIIRTVIHQSRERKAHDIIGALPSLR